jgi:23S rRNA A2030 N6-methylase RlmJ
MIVINPPWQFDEVIKTNLQWAWEALSIDGQGQFRADYL